MANDSSIPSNFLCPITHDIMRCPVLLVDDGHSYEKSALETWLKRNNTSPMTNKELKTKNFVINYNLKSSIEDYSRQQKKIKAKSTFRSFNVHRGRPQNVRWKNCPKLNIVISLLGPISVGKTYLAENIEYGELQGNSKTRSTIGVELRFFHVDPLFEDKFVITIKLHDCSGEERYEAVSKQHFRNCHGAILVADATNIKTFERLQNYWYKKLREICLYDHVETILACNKFDLLENYSSIYRQEFFAQADRFASQYQIPIFNISALRGDNIRPMFRQLILNILQSPSLLKAIKEESSEMKQPIIPTSTNQQTKSDESSCPC